MKHVLFFIAESGFRDEEFFEPKQILEDAGFICDSVSTNESVAEGKMGAMVMPTTSLDVLDVNDYDAFVVVGGPGVLDMGEDVRVKDVLLEAHSKNKLIAAICMAPVILARYGILKDKEVTVFPTGVEAVKGLGAKYVDSDIVVDDSDSNHVLVTARDVEVAEKFGKKLKEMLEK